MSGFRMFFNKDSGGGATPAQQPQQQAPASTGLKPPPSTPVQQPVQPAARPAMPNPSMPPVAKPADPVQSAPLRPSMPDPGSIAVKPAMPSPPPLVADPTPVAPVMPQVMEAPTSVHVSPPVAPMVHSRKVSSEENRSLEGLEKQSMSLILDRMGVPASRIKFAEDRAKMTGEHLSVVMRDFGFLPAEKVAQAIAYNVGLDYFPPSKIEEIDGQRLQPLKSEIPEAFENFVPVSFNGNEVAVAVADAGNISHATNYFHQYKTRVVIASDSTILSIYRRFFSSTEETFDRLLGKFNEIMSSRGEDLEKNPGLMRDIIGTLLRHACHLKVSDIHMHMTEYVGLIKLTLDGESTIFRSVPKELYDRILQKLVTDARVKAEDLRGGMREGTVEFSSETDMKMYDDLFSRYGFRLQLGDAKGGYTAVIRILDRTSNAAELKSLQFDANALSTMQRYIGTASGLVLVTGPTGSGKTTSLYAMLKEIDPVKRSIQTIENPVEYRHGLWMQYELARHAKEEGSEWGKFLKGLLRNAPKVILMGEVRDAETAKTLLDAANTGHLVFTTLHTNSAASAIARLRKLDVDMDALANELLGVLAQRLVRKLCSHCKVPDDRDSTKELIDPSRNPFLKNFPRSPYMASDDGCPHCNYNGYSGRRIIYELLDVTPSVRKLIENNRPTSDIAQHGIRHGFSMWDCGLKLVSIGETSVEALRSVAQPEGYSEE